MNLDYESYTNVDEKIDSLFNEQKFDQALELLNRVQAKFPDDLYDILWKKVIIYALHEDKENCLKALKVMDENSFFCPLEFPIFDAFRDDNRFSAISKASQKLKLEAAKTAKMTYEVITPPDYDETKHYPLFIALHGDSNSIETFKEKWPLAPLLDRGFIVAYVQSSQIVCSNGFGWTANYQIARNDIEKAYTAINSNYNLDINAILVGGFSGGAIAAVEVTMANTIPVKGFISLCPSIKPDSFTFENAKAAKERGIRGVFMEGENEGEVVAEQEMANTFNQLKIGFHFYINGNVGHAFPADFDNKLAESLDFVMDV